MSDPDPFGLARFAAAQDPVMPDVLAELRAGAKRSHWMWFVFPQLQGLGHSPMARRYAIGGLAEAAAYLAHPVLGPRLHTCTALVDAVRDRTAHGIFGSSDDAKLQSCMTLFALTPGDPGVFRRVLARYFAGREDARTLAGLAQPPPPPRPPPRPPSVSRR